MGSVEPLLACSLKEGDYRNHATTLDRTLIAARIKVFIADANGSGAQQIADELNKSHGSHIVYSAQCDVSDWDSQRKAFETAIDTLGGRINYVLPIAGIGERRSFPNKPTSKGFEKPDLKVIEVDEIGVIYTLSLAVQHFRRQEKDKHGSRGKSESM